MAVTKKAENRGGVATWLGERMRNMEIGYNRYPVEMVINQFERGKSVSARSFQAKHGYDKMCVGFFRHLLYLPHRFFPLMFNSLLYCMRMVCSSSRNSVFLYSLLLHTNRVPFHANFQFSLLFFFHSKTQRKIA